MLQKGKNYKVIKYNKSGEQDMQYKLSKNDWIAIGKKTGWLKTAQAEEKGREFFVMAPEEKIREYISSIDESQAQDLADNLAGERDMFIESANGCREVALRDDAGGDADGYRFQLGLEREKLQIASKFAKALAILMERFPNVTTPEAAKPMDEGASRMFDMKAQEEAAQNIKDLRKAKDSKMGI